MANGLTWGKDAFARLQRDFLKGAPPSSEERALLLVGWMSERISRREQGYGLGPGALPPLPRATRALPDTALADPALPRAALPDTASPSTASPEGPLSVLLLLPHNPGDVVMGLQSLSRFLQWRRASPEPQGPASSLRRVSASPAGFRFHFLASEESRSLLEGHPLLAGMIPLPDFALRRCLAEGDGQGALAAAAAFFAALDALGPFSHCLNLYQEPWGAWLHRLIAAEKKEGLLHAGGSRYTLKSRWLRHLFAVPVARAQNPFHAVDLYTRALRAFLPHAGRGQATAPPSPVFPPSFLASPTPHGAGSGSSRPPFQPPFHRPASPGVSGPPFAPPPSPFLVLHPGSAWPGKRWPAERWGRLAALLGRAGHRVVLTGSAEDGALIPVLAEAHARTLAEPWDGRSPPREIPPLENAMGRTTLKEAASLYARALAVVTGDTVAMHLTAAAGGRAFCLFGASNPVETGPYGEGHLVLQGDPAKPESLAFDRPDPWLEALRADDLFALLQEGRPLPGASAWTPLFSGPEGFLRLLSPEGKPHPFQRETSSFKHPSRALPHPTRAEVLAALFDRGPALAAVMDRKPAADPLAGSGGPIPATGFLPEQGLLPEDPFLHANAFLHANVPFPEDEVLDKNGLLRDLIRRLDEALQAHRALPADGTAPLPAALLRALEEAERHWAEATRQDLFWEAYRIALNGLSLEPLSLHLAQRRRLLTEAGAEVRSIAGTEPAPPALLSLEARKEERTGKRETGGRG